MQKPDGTPAWLSEDASVCVDDPFTNEIIVDDWLAPSFNTQQDAGFSSEFLSPLEGCPEEKELHNPHSPTISEELDNFFEQPVQRVTSMRTAFSMNDLQSLQSSATTTSAPSWGHRNVSVKPSLSSVPEGAPAPGSVNLMPISSLYQSSDFQACSLFHNELDFLGTEPVVSMGTRISTAVAGVAYIAPGKATDQPFFDRPDGLTFQQQQFGNAMMAGGPAALAPHFNPPDFGPGPSCMAPAQDMPALLLPGYNAAQTASVKPGFMTMQPESPEEHMVEAVKQEHQRDTSSSGHNGDQMKLQPSGAALRKSHSALELGAWRKMAAGDLDFVDPSGSVRETLQGLELSHQIGKLTPEERLQKILRYRAKRQMRNFNRTIKYQCRKSLADTRPRVRGRFARDNEPGSVLPHETKKALRHKTTQGSSPPPDSQENNEASPGPAVKMEQDSGPSEPSVVPRDPGDAGDSAGPKFAIHSGTQIAPGTSEHHATALAHLYNQWCEADTQLQQKGQSVSVNGHIVA